MKPDFNYIRKKNNLDAALRGEVSPVTIIKDKHNGVYSEGVWLAFNLDLTRSEDQILFPAQLNMNDYEAYEFWKDHKDTVLPIGRGLTPDQAYTDLKNKVVQYWEHQ